MSLAVEALPGAPFGAEIRGLDPGDISDGDRDAIHTAHRERHGLLCFVFERLLDAAELHALTAVFGENEFAPGRIDGVGRRRADGEPERTVDEQVAEWRARGIDPYVTYLGNVDPLSGERRDVPGAFFGEWEWHTDMSYIEVPPTFSLLHSRQVPDDGGDTSFASQVMAAAALPDDLRERVRGRYIKHDSTYGSSGLIRPGMTAPATPIDAVGEVHPIVRVVPTTGDEALFLGRRTNGWVVDLPLDESDALLDELWAHATRPEFSYTHRWEVGQVVVWDNRMLLHKREPFDPTSVRDMWRTQTRGEPVVAAG